MTTDCAFNENFEKEYADNMIHRVQSMKQCCDACHKACTTIKRCSKCKVATYCGRNCQAKHWNKGGGHKHSCKFWWDKTFPLYKLPFGYKMRALNYFGEEDFDVSMDMHTKLCLEELVRCNITTVNVLIFCTESLDKVYLNVGIAFGKNDGERHEITVLNMYLVDEGQEALNNINRGTGIIGNDATQKVVDGLQCFLVQVEEAVDDKGKTAIELRTLTYGRGLMNVCSDKKFQTLVCTNHQSPFMWLPDMEYAMENTRNAALNAFHGI